MVMKYFLLFIISCLSFCLLCPIAIVYSIYKNKFDFLKYAISVDQTINAISGELLDKLFLLDKSVFKFGDMDKTISYNLGKNKKFNNLNKLGLFICWVLHLIDSNHVEESYNKDI